MKSIIALILGAIILYLLLDLSRTINIDKSDKGTPDTGINEIIDSTESESDTEESTDKSLSEITFEDTDGNTVTINELLGKPMLVHFWASWQESSLNELPVLQKAYEEYSSQIEFVIICITDGEYETLESAKEFLADKGYTLPIYFDVNSEALHLYKLYSFTSVSRTYLYDESGAFLKKSSRAVDEKMLEEGISILLN